HGSAEHGCGEVDGKEGIIDHIQLMQKYPGNLLFFLRHQIHGFAYEIPAIHEDVVGEEYSHDELGEEYRQIGGKGGKTLLQDRQEPFGYGYGNIAYLLYISQYDLNYG